MRQSHLILSNALIIWASRVLLLVPQLILVPYLISTIGESGYGVYALIWSLLMSIGQLEQSLQLGVVKYSAAFLAEDRVDKVNRVVSSSFVYSMLLAVVACVCIFIAAAFAGDPTGDLGFSLFVVGVLVLLMIPLTPYVAVIQSRQRYYVTVVAETLSKYIALGAVVTWFSLMTPTVGALMVITAGMLLLSRLAQVPVAYRMVPGLRNRVSLFDRQAFRLIVAFGGVIVLVALCGIANSTGVRWLMASLVSTGFVAHLAIILMPGLFLIQIIQAMTITIMPATSAYEATGNTRMLKELLIRSMRYACILVLAGSLVAALLIKDVLTLWVGPGYAFLAPYSLAFFLSAAFLMTTSSAHHMLNGLGRLRITFFNALVGLVLVPFVLILVLFFVWRNPYIAVTVGLAAGNIVPGLLQIGFAANAVHADLRDVFTRVYARSCMVAAPVIVLALALVRLGRLDGLLEMGCVSVLAVLLFLGGCYVFVATPAERQQAKALLHAILIRTAAVRWARSRSKRSPQGSAIRRTLQREVG